MAGVQGARHCLLPGRRASARPHVAGRHCGDLWHRLAVSADVLAGRLRGVHYASPLPTCASAGDPHHQSARAVGEKILDGRNRYRACIAAGFRPVFEHLPFVDPVVYVISANIHRRHLTPENKRDLIALLLKEKPEASDRSIAKTVKVSPTTVGAVRAKIEAKGDVSKLDTRTDTKGRKQPARRTRGERARALEAMKAVPDAPATIRPRRLRP
jgi:hypothetical protein